MLNIKNYFKASTLEEAYELNQNKANVIVGGMLWLKMQDRNINTAIDLSGLGLDAIEENDTEFKIGAMVTLRQLETHTGLLMYTRGAVKEAVKHIVGVQFRNMATVGGSIFGRYGFSDVLTVFMAMDAVVKLYGAGEIPVKEFASMKYDRDVLEYIIVPKKNMQISYMSLRNSATDFPVLTCCSSCIDGTYATVIGARPGRAECFTDDENILTQGIDEDSAKAFGEYISDKVITESNNRAGAGYRRKIAGVLTKRTLLEIGGQGQS